MAHRCICAGLKRGCLAPHDTQDMHALLSHRSRKGHQYIPPDAHRLRALLGHRSRQDHFCRTSHSQPLPHGSVLPQTFINRRSRMGHQQTLPRCTRTAYLDRSWGSKRPSRHDRSPTLAPSAYSIPCSIMGLDDTITAPSPVLLTPSAQSGPETALLRASSSPPSPWFRDLGIQYALLGWSGFGLAA